MVKVRHLELFKKLKREGCKNIQVCPLPPANDASEHIHHENTISIIISGAMEIIDSRGSHIYFAGDRYQVPAGTTHRARRLSKTGYLITAVK